MSGIFRSSNTNPNPPLFFATVTLGVGGTALGPALRNLGINTDRCWARNGTSPPYLGEGLYLAVVGSTSRVRIYGNSGECAANANRYFEFAAGYNFLPIANPENLWLVGMAAGTTLGIRGH